MTVSDAGSGIDSLQYAWTQSAEVPSGGWDIFTSGDTLSQDSGEGKWFLHIHATDLAGHVADVYSNSFMLDNTPPTVTVTSKSASMVNAAFPITVNFSEPVTGFTASDLAVVNGTVADLTMIDETSYSAAIFPTESGHEVTVSIEAGVAADEAGNKSTASNALSFMYDTTKPVVTFGGFTDNQTFIVPPTSVSIAISEAVYGVVDGAPLDAANALSLMHMEKEGMPFADFTPSYDDISRTLTLTFTGTLNVGIYKIKVAGNTVKNVRNNTLDATSASFTVAVPTIGDVGSTPAVSKPVIDENGVKLDPAAIDTAKPSVTLEVTPKDGTAYVSIPAGILTDFAGKNAAFFIEIKTPYGSYKVPVNLASLIPGLQDLLAKNGLKAGDISFKITLSDKSGDKDIQASFASNLPNGKEMGAIVDFHIDIIHTKTGQTIGTADKFSQALTRVIPMPKNVTNMPEQWGAFRYNETMKKFEFVAARSVRIDGVWYVMIGSYTNSVYVVADNVASFGDVEKHWSRSHVELAAAKGLVDGVGGGKYAPDKAVTRAEFTAMLVRALGRGVSSSSSVLSYDDVKQGAWYFDVVAQAKELGLLDFVNGTSFKPEQLLTREEMASMLAAAIKLEKQPIS